MAIQGVKIDGVLVLYKLTRPHRLTHPGRINAAGWEVSNGGTSISRSEARDAVATQRIPRNFVAVPLTKFDRECVLEALEQWVSGKSEIFAE